MSAPPNVAIHLRSHRNATWILFPAAAVALIGAAAWLATLLGGDGGGPAGTAWVGALAGIGGLVAVAVLAWAVAVTAERAVERRQILRVLEQVIACWPQYASEKQWRQVITQDAKRETSVADIAWPVGIVTVVVGAIAVGAGLQGMWSAVLVLAAFWVLVSGLVGGRAWSRDRQRRADRHRRERLLPYPACWLAAEAIYHEDWGLVTLDQVTRVRLIPPAEVSGARKRLRSEARAGDLTVELDPLDLRLARSGWSLLQFTLDEQVARTLWHHLRALVRSRIGRLPDLVSVVHVRVPPGREAEADGVVAAVTRRWLAGESPDRPTAMTRRDP